MAKFPSESLLAQFVESSRPIEAVVFDLDGTLIDSEHITDRLMRKHLKAAGISSQIMKLSQFHGLTWGEIVNRFHSLAPDYSNQISVDALRESFERELMLAEVKPIQDAVRFVSQASQHFRCVVASSSPRTTIAKALDRLQIRSRIEFIVGEEDVEHSKPAPDPYLLAQTTLDLPPTRIITFEDSDAGITASMTAGMWTIGINRRKDWRSEPLEREPHLTIGTYADLPSEFCTMIR